jgi:hypothetical protein
MIVGNTRNKQGEVFRIRDKSNLHHAERSAAAAFPFDNSPRFAFCHCHSPPFAFSAPVLSLPNITLFVCCFLFRYSLIIRPQSQVLLGTTIVAIASPSSAGRINLPPTPRSNRIDREGFLRCA